MKYFDCQQNKVYPTNSFQVTDFVNRIMFVLFIYFELSMLCCKQVDMHFLLLLVLMAGCETTSYVHTATCCDGV